MEKIRKLIDELEIDISYITKKIIANRAINDVCLFLHGQRSTLKDIVKKLKEIINE